MRLSKAVMMMMMAKFPLLCEQRLLGKQRSDSGCSEQTSVSQRRPIEEPMVTQQGLWATDTHRHTHHVPACAANPNGKGDRLKKEQEV